MGGIPSVPPSTPSPVSPTLPTGINYAATAMGPLSGVSGVGFFCGPWVIEGQTMKLGYQRVPRLNFSGVELSLSSVTAIAYNYGSTHMRTFIDATWYRVSSTDCFPTSADYSQPQTFEFFPRETDYQGNSYGSLTASTLGPVGRIYTKTPYYSRRMMTAAEIAGTAGQLGIGSKTIQGADFLRGVSSCDIASNNMQHVDHSFESNAITPYERGTFKSDFDRWTNGNSPIDRYTLANGYSIGQESLLAIVNYIDSCGWGVKDCWVEYMPGTRPITSLAENFHSQLTPPQPNAYFQGIPEYDPTRHVHNALP